MRLTIVCTCMMALAACIDAQSQGYLRRASGPPVNTTSLTPPANSPFAAPGQAPSPSMQQPKANVTTYASNGLPALGACYCTPIEDAVFSCFHNTTGIYTNNKTVIDTDCQPPLEYNCQVARAQPEVYSQEFEGSVYRQASSTLSANSSKIIPLETGCVAAGSPVPSPSTGTLGPVQGRDYTGVFPSNFVPLRNSSGNVTYAKNVILNSASILSINPKPDALKTNFAGVDITMNGQLNGLPLEPPNPSICVGNGFAMEVTNDVLIVYSAANGSVVAGPTDFQHFFGVAGPPYNGLSDPYCLYDAADSKRFYVSMSMFSCRTRACLSKNTVRVFSYLLIGVSKTSDPRDGFLGPYFVATDGINPDTNEAYPGFNDCGYPSPGFTGKGCLGDFPNPGMDKHGFWFGMNMFTINASVLIGANVFGVRKIDLLEGRYTNPSVVTYTNWAPYPGFTIVPSMTQTNSNHSAAQNGSVYLMSSDSFSYSGQNNDTRGIPSIRSWAITNTQLLSLNFPNNATPSLSAPVTMLTEPLQFSSTALKNPSAPSGVSVPQPSGPVLGGQEERMRQVAYSGGYLYSSFNNPVVLGDRNFQSLAYFVLAPNFTAAGQYTAQIVNQGYVATNGAHLLNGAITATRNGSMVITGSVVGQGMYLSAFYAQITPQFGVGPIRVPKVSANPLLNEGPGQLPQRRTGDYATAVLDENDNAWLVAHWASDRFTNLSQPDSGNSRFANWGTYVMQINPYILT